MALNKMLPNRYKKLDYVSNNELARLYNNSFALAYPSDYEGFGFPVLEAQACGCPVICQPLSSIPEVSGDSCIYVNKDDIVVYNWVDENGAFLASENGLVRVVHRVVEIAQDDNGNISLITRGDNNLEDDNMPVPSHNFVGIYNHKASYLTTFFLKQNIQNYPGVFIFLMISISIVICFDIIEFIKYLIKRASA